MQTSLIQSALLQIQDTQSKNKPVQTQKPAASNKLPQDTVTLTAAARNAPPNIRVGDVDHDGDNH